MNFVAGGEREIVVAVSGDAQAAGGAADDFATLDHRHALVLVEVLDGGAHPIATTGFDGGLPGAVGLDCGV